MDPSSLGRRTVGAAGCVSGIGRRLAPIAYHGSAPAGVALLAKAHAWRDVVPERRQRVLSPVRLAFVRSRREGVPEVAGASALHLLLRLDVDVGRVVLGFALHRHLQDFAIGVGKNAWHPFRSVGVEFDRIVVAPSFSSLSGKLAGSAVVVVEHLRHEAGGAAVPNRPSLQPRRRRARERGGSKDGASGPHGCPVGAHVASLGKLGFAHDLGARSGETVDLSVEKRVLGDYVEASAALELHRKLRPRDVAAVVFALRPIRSAAFLSSEENGASPIEAARSPQALFWWPSAACRGR